MKRVFAFVGFSAAITLIVLNTLPYNFVKFILLSAVILLFVSLLVKSLRQEKVLPITFGSMLFACLIFIACMQGTVLPQKALDGQTANTQFQITDIESETDDGYMYTVKTQSISMSGVPQNIKLKVKSEEKIHADYYDTISGTLSFYSYTDNGFNSFGDYGDKIFLRANLIDVTSAESTDKPLNYYIIQLRLKIKDILSENLDAEKAGLALSVFTGDKSLLDEDINHSFKACGMSHMTAVSGLHISVICLCIYYALKYLKVPRTWATAATLLILLIYSGVADYSKSVLRAGIMIAVMLLAKLINNKADTVNSLGFAVFILCLNPFAVTDASAVLTVTAVIGLCIVKPSYDKFIRPENKIIRYLYDGFFISASVLLSTLPVLWLFFGRVSLMSLILNMICIPIFEIALVSVLLLCIFSPVPILAYAPKGIASFSLDVLIKTADFSNEHFGFLYLNISDSLFGIAIAGVLLLMGISLLVNNDIKVKIISAFVALLFAVTTVFSVYDYSKNAYVTVSDNGAVIIYDKDCAVLIDVDEKGDFYTVENTVGTRSFSKIVAINSLRCKNDIIKLFPDAEFVSSKNDAPEMCEHISVQYNNKILTVTLFDKVFKIYDDYVTIGEYKAYRNIYDRFNEKGSVTFIAAKNADVQMR